MGWMMPVVPLLVLLLGAAACSDPTPPASDESEPEVYWMRDPRHPVTSGGRLVGWLEGDSARVRDSVLVVWEPRLDYGPGTWQVEARIAERRLDGFLLVFREGVVVRSRSAGTLMEGDSLAFDAESNGFSPAVGGGRR